jgi:hypothetical protein
MDEALNALVDEAEETPLDPEEEARIRLWVKELGDAQKVRRERRKAQGGLLLEVFDAMEMLAMMLHDTVAEELEDVGMSTTVHDLNLLASSCHKDYVQYLVLLPSRSITMLIEDGQRGMFVRRAVYIIEPDESEETK